MSPNDTHNVQPLVGGDEWTLVDTVQLADRIPARIYNTKISISYRVFRVFIVQRVHCTLQSMHLSKLLNISESSFFPAEGPNEINGLFTLTNGCIPVQTRIEGSMYLHANRMHIPDYIQVLPYSGPSPVDTKIVVPIAAHFSFYFLVLFKLIAILLFSFEFIAEQTIFFV